LSTLLDFHNPLSSSHHLPLLFIPSFSLPLCPDRGKTHKNESIDFGPIYSFLAEIIPPRSSYMFTFESTALKAFSREQNISFLV
jgi:hypothetical protein